MSPASPSARERIVEAATRILGKEGERALTTRRVAAEAKVNLGLLHYYFASKEELYREVMGLCLTEFRTIALSIDVAIPDPAESLARSLSEALGKALDSPGFLFSLLGLLLKTAAGGMATHDISTIGQRAEGIPLSLLLDTQRALTEKVGAILAAKIGPTEPEFVAHRVLQLFTSIFHPLVLTDFSRLVYGLDLRDESARLRYVRDVVASALAPRATTLSSLAETSLPEPRAQEPH